MDAAGSWRSISVRLNADVGPYVTSMGRAESATRAFAKGALAAAGGVEGLDKASKRLDRFGNEMSTKVTLPVLATGVAVTKMASDFNTSFTQMQSLAGVSASEVDGLKESVNGLAGETAQSPQELAQALYFVRSSGVEGAAAMETLEVSAKASAIGLGETAGVARAVTAALNTYGTDTLSAAKATDILAAAVTAGQAEATEFAPQLGRLLPIAQNLGIGFEEVAGGLAFLTQAGGDTSQAATQLSGILQKLLRPSQQGAAELERVGLSAEKLREVAGSQGLVPALQLLQQKLGGNSEAMGRIFEDTEGLVGVLGLLRNEGADAAGVIDDVSSSAGLLDEKFAALQETDEFKFQQALADLQRVAIDVGNDLIPLLSDVAGGVSAVVDAFTALPQGAQTIILGLTGVAAALGPIAKLGGTTADMISRLVKASQSDAFAKFGSSLSSMVSGSGTATRSIGLLISTVAASPAAMAVGVAGLAGLGYAMLKLRDDSNKAKDAAKAVAEQAQATGESAKEVFLDDLAKSIAGLDGIEGFGKNAERMVADLAYIGTGVRELGEMLFAGEEDFQDYIDRLREGVESGRYSSTQIENDIAQIEFLREAALGATEQEEKYAQNTQLLADAQERLGGSTEETAGKTRDAGAAAGEAAGQVDTSNEAWERQLEILGLVNEQLATRIGLANTAFGAAMGYESAQTDTQTAMDKLKVARAQGDPKAIAEAERDLVEAIQRQSEALVDNVAAQKEADGQKLSSADAAKLQIAELERLTEQTGVTSEALEVLKGRLERASEQHKVDLSTAEAHRRIDELNEKLGTLHGRYIPINVEIQTKIDGLSLGSILGSLAGPYGQRRWGGIDHYATGGVRQAMVGSGKNLVWWDEPETGGEAYVPRYGNERRSLAVLSEAASWYGMGLASRDGRAAYGGRQQVPPPVHVTVTGGWQEGSGSNNRTVGEVHFHGSASYGEQARMQRQFRHEVLYGS